MSAEGSTLSPKAWRRTDTTGRDVDRSDCPAARERKPCQVRTAITPVKPFSTILLSAFADPWREPRAGRAGRAQPASPARRSSLAARAARPPSMRTRPWRPTRRPVHNPAAQREGAREGNRPLPDYVSPARGGPEPRHIVFSTQHSTALGHFVLARVAGPRRRWARRCSSLPGLPARAFNAVDRSVIQPRRSGRPLARHVEVINASGQQGFRSRPVLRHPVAHYGSGPAPGRLRRQ